VIDRPPRPTTPAAGYTMPLLAGQATGGPHPDDALMVGFTLGQIHTALGVLRDTGAVAVTWRVSKDLIPQLDLFGMDAGFTTLTVRQTDPPSPDQVLATVSVSTTDVADVATTTAPPVAAVRVVRTGVHVCPSCVRRRAAEVDFVVNGEVIATLGGCPDCRTGMYADGPPAP
jgi:hypothetical protein